MWSALALLDHTSQFGSHVNSDEPEAKREATRLPMLHKNVAKHKPTEHARNGEIDSVKYAEQSNYPPLKRREK